MRSRSLILGVLALGAFGLTACSDETTTEPSRTVEPAPASPDLVVASNSWLKRADMPRSRTDLAVATVKNAAGQSIVYAIGGATACTAYRPAWSRPITSRPTHGHSGVAATQVGMVQRRWGHRWEDLCLRGVLYPRVCSHWSALHVQYPATNTWTKKRDIPIVPADSLESTRYPSGNGVTGVIDGQLYVVSGCFLRDHGSWGLENL